MLDRLARHLVRHRKLVLVSWIVLVAGMVGVGVTFAGESDTDFSNPGSESQEAADLLTEAGVVTDPMSTGQLVVVTDPSIDEGVRNPDVRAVVEDLMADIEAEAPGVTVDSLLIPPSAEPGTPADAEDARGNISPDGTVAFADIDLGSGNDTELANRADAILELRDDFDAAGVTVELAGDQFIQEPPGGAAEGVGMLMAIVILLIAFGSLIAAGLPLLTALFGVGVGAAIVMLAMNFIAMPSFILSMTIMLGIGVGIDYALLKITRFRTSLAEGMSVEDAVARTMTTAGRSVLVAGCTVAIAISGLLIMGGSMGLSMVVAAGAGVLMVMLAALTLLPALLGLIGHRVDKFGLPHRAQRNDRPGLAYKWSRFIQRRPWPAALAGAAILLALAAPALDLRFGFSDAGNRAESDTTRKAYDALADGFGNGANGPLLLVADLGDGADDSAVAAVADAVAGTPGVSDVAPPFSSDDGELAVLRVVPETGPQDEATTDLVHTLRDDVIPYAVANSDLDVFVTGATAASIDFADVTFDRMPVLFGGVLLASFILLALVFRSLVVPLKAIIANLLSLGAAFGVMVAVFQWGWGMELIGVGKVGPTEAWVPMTMFAIAYGLSMDYEIFLMSRIREEYVRTRDNALAVADGLAKTARVITAAAAILVCVFASFVLFDDRGMKTMGLGLATAIFVDATVVRMLLIPAVMELLGDRNWYWPKALRRVPSFDVEAKESEAAREPALATP